MIGVTSLRMPGCRKPLEANAPCGWMPVVPPKAVGPVGCLVTLGIVLLMVVCAVQMADYQPPPRSPARIEADRKRQEAARIRAEKKQQTADRKAEEKRQRKSETEQRLARGPSDVKKLMAALRKEDMDESFVVRGKYERIGRTATLTLPNDWHYEIYQSRLQAAQGLWKLWSTIHSPNDPDLARIKLVDLMGNEVGGSRLLGGSLIWVKKD